MGGRELVRMDPGSAIRISSRMVLYSTGLPGLDVVVGFTNISRLHQSQPYLRQARRWGSLGPVHWYSAVDRHSTLPYTTFSVDTGQCTRTRHRLLSRWLVDADFA